MKTIQAKYVIEGMCRADATVQVTPTTSLAIRGIAQQVLQLDEVFRNFSMHTALAERLLAVKLSVSLTAGVPFEVYIDKMMVDLYQGRYPHIALMNSKGSTTVVLKLSIAELRELVDIDTSGNLCIDCNGACVDLVCTSCQTRTLQALQDKLDQRAQRHALDEAIA